MNTITWRPAHSDHRTPWARVARVRTLDDERDLMASWAGPRLSHGDLVRSTCRRRDRLYVVDAEGIIRRAPGIIAPLWERTGVSHLPALTRAILAHNRFRFVYRLCAAITRRMAPFCNGNSAATHAIEVMQISAVDPEYKQLLFVDFIADDSNTHAENAVSLAIDAAFTGCVRSPAPLVDALLHASLAVDPGPWTRIPVSLTEAACALAGFDPPTVEAQR